HPKRNNRSRQAKCAGPRSSGSQRDSNARAACRVRCRGPYRTRPMAHSFQNQSEGLMNYENPELAEALAGAECGTADKRSSESQIERLAKLPRLEYERQREDTARLLGVRLAALDKIVREQRASAEDDAATLAHWKVEPSSEPVDGAALLDRLRQVFR